MENLNVKIRLLGLVIGLVATIISFIVYPFWTAVVLVYFQNAIVGLSVLLGAYFMVIGQIAYWLFIKMLIYPAFIQSSFSEITPRFFVYSLLIFGLLNIISLYIQWYTIKDFFLSFRSSNINLSGREKNLII